MKLSKNVRDKVAFDIFSTSDTHQALSDKYKVSRSLISSIAVEYNLQRRKRNNQSRSPQKGRRSPVRSDIETVNWTHDDDLIMKRIERRESKIVEEIHRLVNAAINL